MPLYSPVDLTGNVNMIEKLVLGGTGTGDLPILSPTLGRQLSIPQAVVYPSGSCLSLRQLSIPQAVVYPSGSCLSLRQLSIPQAVVCPSGSCLSDKMRVVDKQKC